MKPANGVYRLTTNGTPPVAVNYTVTDAGIPTTFGLMVWEEAGDCYRKGTIAIECTGEGTFIAVNGPDNYSGTCVKIA